MSPSFTKIWKDTRKLVSRHPTTVSNATAIFNSAASAAGIPTVPELEFTPGEEGVDDEDDTRVSGNTKEYYVEQLSKTAYTLLEKDLEDRVSNLSPTVAQDDGQYTQDVRVLQMKYSEAVRHVNREIQAWGDKSSKSDVSELDVAWSSMFDNWKLGVVMPSEADSGDRVPLRITSSAAELTSLDGAEFCKVEAGVIDRLGLRSAEAYTKYSNRTVTTSVVTKPASTSTKLSGIGGPRYEW